MDTYWFLYDVCLCMMCTKCFVFSRVYCVRIYSFAFSWIACMCVLECVLECVCVCVCVCVRIDLCMYNHDVYEMV